MAGSGDGSGIAPARTQLADQIKSYLKEQYPDFSDKAIDDLVQYFMDKAADAVPELSSLKTPVAATPSPTPKATPGTTLRPEPTPRPQATETPAPDTSWIEGYVQSETDALLPAHAISWIRGGGGLGAASFLANPLRLRLG